jgi:hypothetical protein
MAALSSVLLLYPSTGVVNLAHARRRASADAPQLTVIQHGTADLTTSGIVDEDNTLR